MTRKKVAERHAAVNRCYKDTVFRMLFADKENLLSLYNAMNGKSYTNPDDLEIVTLENAIYMEMKNDLAFIIDTRLYLYEHQSTFNPNIPLRDLLYISCEYQKTVNDRSLYSSRLQKIPAPRFIVFYNGTQEKEDISELRLSDAFEGSREADLELKVKMVNINEGHNQELMKQCRILWEYAKYVAKVRGYTRSVINRYMSHVDHSARCFGMFLPKSRDIQVKMPSPKVIFMHFDIVTGRSVTSNDKS